ncbi:hypothetical protein C1H46_027289 [Malus baccata]|uniref:Uncharacterized protein n=1 Tax=Malus baccata TaxID=106549 RepID=A0A540LLE4_MALBA|nr:hypothetical protein C1H46_027289 [Malus baccata]
MLLWHARGHLRAKQGSLASEGSWKHLLSPASDANSSAGAYHGSPTSNRRTETSPAHSMSGG